MSGDDFTKGVEDGLRLSKRIYFGKDRSVAPPKPITAMEKATRSYYPVSPMVYAVISNPGIVDNPDVPSYQPHVHGRCDPPALIPLQMNGIGIEVDCYLDTAFVTMTGSWRVHCVMGSASCDCRLAIPMGLEGSILGVEVEVTTKSYTTQLVVMDEKGETESVAKAEGGGFLKPHIFTLTIPQVDGGSNISVKGRWSQKIIYKGGEFTLDVPFSFPEYVTPAGKKLSKKEKIQLNINVGLGTEVVCRTTNHPLKERKREAGKLAFLYEAEVLTWSNTDFVFTYSVPTSSAFGGVLLQSPSSLSIDQKELFSLYLFPGADHSRKVIRKEVLFVVDISGSMKGRTIEATKNAVVAVLSKLDQGDSFSIMAFNDQTYLFSSTMELATKEALEKATEWIGMNFIAGGGTNMSIALDKAIEMLSGTKQSVPIIFFITDGAVENERQICEAMIKQLRNQGSDLCPRIYTFGIGSFYNPYFLRMLAMIGRGHYDAASDPDSIVAQMEALFSKAASTVLLNIAIDSLDDVDSLEVCFHVSDLLLFHGPLVLFGKYTGAFPDTLKAMGILADMSNFTIDLKVQRTKDIPLDKILAKQQIEQYTAQAWFSQDKKLEEKVAKISMQTGVVSEYTRMTLLETVQEKHATTSSGVKQGKKETITPQKVEVTKKSHMIKVLPHLGVGFGNLIATIENTPPGYEPKLPDQAEMLVRAAGNCCVNMCSKCCCLCCIQACSQMNDQCAIVITQLCGALACLGCFACCELCCGQD
ncbi:von Willebrand factor, type A [Cynara cardunculus var. scolymus]|uniref:von Willebrand factor, type A n=1 Tax=Cynara cardunculus var. scolymus TaxID=59895 RepID=A0A118JW14_CYNCS|nr:von Willebrand factor, type A [Cynara cardunculus var. scolymus]